MNFSLSELQAFVSIVRTGTFTGAANRINITQPALSRRIQLIENAIGVPLFERLSTGPMLTDAGQEFLPYAEAVLMALEEAEDAARGNVKGDRGQVSFAAIGMLCTTRLVNALRQFCADAAGAELSLSFHANTSESLSDVVLHGKATWGLRYGEDPRLHSEVIGQERLLIVCSRDHKLATAKNVSSNRLADEPWISSPLGIGPDDGSLWSDMAAPDVAGRHIMLTDSIAAQKSLIEAGFGVGLVPSSSVEADLRDGSLRQIDTAAPQPTVPIALVRRKGTFVSKASQQFARLIIEAHAE
ncbi:LysR family transcriptional regulator [Sphingobium subterraneum]|uniref:DNA-binding transcriptional LysR family regulator n=1 Tax=Sphingobium subterraneum TaxID=627688 RepID=A0A841IY91_9SPHN|nr:LysR family transcriptional regulator [Sphingobium subterraneum]MBB6123374.1 DNA-binding transcriptional LysR family regulator [Sphingobium subterraneum]